MSNEYICHYGIPGMKWGRRTRSDGSSYKKGTAVAYNKSGDNTQARRKRTLRANMTKDQRRQSNKQIVGSIAGSVVGTAVGMAAKKAGAPGIAAALLSNGGRLGGVAVANIGNKTNANLGRTMVSSLLLGPFGASTVYDQSRFK